MGSQPVHPETVFATKILPLSAFYKSFSKVKVGGGVDDEVGSQRGLKDHGSSSNCRYSTQLNFSELNSS